MSSLDTQGKLRYKMEKAPKGEMKEEKVSDFKAQLLKTIESSLTTQVLHQVFKLKGELIMKLLEHIKEEASFQSAYDQIRQLFITRFGSLQDPIVEEILPGIV